MKSTILITNTETGKLVGCGPTVTIDATNELRPLFSQFFQKSIKLPDTSFGNQLYPSIRQVFHKTCNLVSAGNLLGGKSEAHALNLAGVENMPAFSSSGIHWR